MSAMGTTCEVCTLASTANVSVIGPNFVALYPDQRYALRCIVAPTSHLPGPAGLSRSYLIQTQELVFGLGAALASMEDVRRINYAILGNRETDHFHWHVIPRYHGESNATKAPWPHKKKLLESAAEFEAAKRSLRTFADAAITELSRLGDIESFVKDA